LAAGEPIVAVLERARDLGFLGPGPIEAHLVNADAFGEAAGAAPALGVDLGTGGGVPGLVLAARWPASRWLLIDSIQKRAAFLTDAVEELGMGERVTVTAARAELVGRDPAWRATADLVTARSFGPPAVTAECAAPLLHLGGVLLVSEPPDAPDDRWPARPLAALGLADDGLIVSPTTHLRHLSLRTPCPDTAPRRVGIPTKRPLWSV
jgi:16S rRNA (guanine527-N7)-methyltransferase